MSWPKKITTYLHGSKDTAYETAMEIGLSEEAYREEFRGLLYEIEFDILVQEDGTYRILEVREVQSRDKVDIFLPRMGPMMRLCETCGNKRCPHATDKALECTGSNEPGQKGSAYE